MNKVKTIICLGAFFWACVISGAALYLPPQGEIDSSVLVLIAQLLVLVSTIVGIDLPIIIKKNDHNNSSSVAEA